MRVSHETIYRSLFIQARGALKKELLEHLRSKRRIRRSQHSRIFKDGRGQIPEAISIRERPAEVEDRAIPGHWEGDLLRGPGNSHIATILPEERRPNRRDALSSGRRLTTRHVRYRAVSRTDRTPAPSSRVYQSRLLASRGADIVMVQQR
jgi:IS30 family transposase